MSARPSQALFAPHTLNFFFPFFTSMNHPHDRMVWNSPVAMRRVGSPRAMPNECFTDKGYGRYQSCDADAANSVSTAEASNYTRTKAVGRKVHGFTTCLTLRSGLRSAGPNAPTSTGPFDPRWSLWEPVLINPQSAD
jgi:hypothetical protein